MSSADLEVSRLEMQQLDELDESFDDDFDQEDEDLKWSWTYVQVCLLLPIVDGLINAYCWAALALHYVDMGWPISRSGLSAVIGYTFRPFTQQLQIHFGFWVALPLGLIHLAAVIIGIIYTDEWAVIIEIGLLQATDATMTVEGIAFDTFKSSEVVARQAGSTVLAVFTMSVAASVTIGGVIYDTVGWKGMSLFHLVCLVAMLSLLILQPAVRKSFKEFWFKAGSTKELGDTLPIVPTDVTVAESDLILEDFDLPGAVKDELQVDKIRNQELKEEHQIAVEESTPERDDEVTEQGRHPGDRASQASRNRASQASRRSRHTHHTVMSVMSGASARTCRTALTVRTGRTGATHVTGATVMSRITALTNLKDSNDFQYHFAASSALPASVAQRAGPSDEEKKTPKSKSVPRDLLGPLALIVLCQCCNTFNYMFEFGTFAIYFKEYHNWDAATWASLAQTAGDLTAAIMMKVLPNNVDEEVEEVGVLKRLTMQPYNLSCLLVCWVFCNAGMISPLLPIAVTAQIVMGTVYVYTLKMISDLNLFYSLGDSDMFLKFAVYCKNAEALAACVASFFGPFLYEQVSLFGLCFMVTLMSLCTDFLRIDVCKTS